MVRMINILIIIKFLPVFVYVYTENHEHCNNFTVYDGNFVEEKKGKMLVHVRTQKHTHRHSVHEPDQCFVCQCAVPTLLLLCFFFSLLFAR